MATPKKPSMSKKEPLISVSSDPPPKKKQKGAKISAKKKNIGLQVSLSSSSFKDEHLTSHETICEKSSPMRKNFYGLQKIQRDTSAERYKRRLQQKKSSCGLSPEPGPTNPTDFQEMSKWRKQHEAFFRVVHDAKQAQAEQARLKELSNRPKPTPFRDVDWKICPHCLRRLNESAAETHIPFCAKMHQKQ